MAKKSKKRQLEDESNNVNEKINAKSHLSNDDAPHKKKVKISSEKSEKKDELNVVVKQGNFKSKEASKKKELQNASSTATVEGDKFEKKIKKKVKKQRNSADNKTTPSDSKNEENTKSKRQEHFKKKRAEFKEKRKLLGSRAGISTAVAKLSLTEMKKKIAEIESRETISKTAARKLRILKKKVQVQESGDEEKDVTSEKISKKNAKNKLANKTILKTANSKTNTNKSIDMKKIKKEKPAAKDLGKNLYIEDRVGNAVADDSAINSNEEENEPNVHKSTKSIEKLQKNTSGNFNITNNKNDEDSEENDDEDSDECENESSEETNALDEMVNKSESEGSDEDDTDSESKNVEEDKKVDMSVTKLKNALNISNKNSNKAKPKPNEKDPNKKQRYVLFVGNIAYDATTVDLKKHFLTKVEKVKDVRIPLNPGTNKPRGFAYVEVENSEDYEKALSLHNTFINGRQLKVEYTTSGSKKASRKPEIIHKNKKLHALRKEGKLAGSKKFSHKRSFRRNFKNFPKKEFGKKES